MQEPEGLARRLGEWTIQIAQRFDKAKGLDVIQRRWVAEQTFA